MLWVPFERARFLLCAWTLCRTIASREPGSGSRNYRLGPVANTTRPVSSDEEIPYHAKKTARARCRAGCKPARPVPRI